MQTEAEKYLIKIIKKILILSKEKLKIINLGAAKSTVVEDDLLETSDNFICDRSDIDNCQVDKKYVKKTYRCSLEEMSVISTNAYDLAFANFVMEHIYNSEKMASECARIIKPQGDIVISLPNPQAPEFILAKNTPTWFHQLLRKKGHDKAYPVNYAYKNIDNFIRIMVKNKWYLVEKKYFPATYSYLHRFPVINIISGMYDKAMNSLHIKPALGHVVLHFKLTIDKK